MNPLRRPRLTIKALLTLTAGLLMPSALLSDVIAAAPSDAVRSVEPRQNADDKWPTLSDEQIDLIRVYEVHLNTNGQDKPRIAIPAKTLNEFMQKYSEDDRMPRGRDEQEAFRRADGTVQLAKMFEMRAREFYGEVRVRSQIESLRSWTKLHDRYIFGYFRQHFGAGQVPGLLLLPQGRDGGRIAMTNFYLLTQARVNGAPIIDRNNPSESLLVQWGLPLEDSKFDPPEAVVNAGWQPYFRNTEDKRFTEMVDWIKSLIRVNQDTDYGIKFSLPKQDAAAAGSAS